MSVKTKWVDMRPTRVAWHLSDEGKRVTRAIIEELDGDGHSIYDPKLLTGAGMPAEFAEAYSQEHKSDGSPKGSIESGGAIVPSLRGVYSLSFYRRMCELYGVPSLTHCLGRGSEARELHRRLVAFFDAATMPQPPESA